MKKPTKSQMARARKAISRIRKTTDRREHLRVQGRHCTEWWWCEIQGGHRGPCVAGWMTTREAMQP